MSQKKVDLALKLLDSVVELAPDYTETWNRRAYVHFVQRIRNARSATSGAPSR
jgi:hypothetical protein